MEHVLKFLKDLTKNNNRDWFEKNKARYVEAKNAFEVFLEEFHRELVLIDESLAGLNPRKQAFRIYRDVRFSKDKRPYKINMGAGFSPGGKMMQEPGYYIHIEPGNCFVASGLYQPDPENLAKVRQEIDYNADAFLHILKNKSFRKYFDGLDDFDRVKTAPKGYPKDHPQIEVLKNKSFIISHAFTDQQAKERNFYKQVVAACRAAKPFNDFLKEAIS
ncbi:MAG: DUF2461 domain-containing protein [Cyclobacteriaceae bacterium]|jgi:uncharacterized protein (TIGR02453 family)|nr:DUF2461 domain-containing protein [Cyclobacteriaceae bacterium]